MVSFFRCEHATCTTYYEASPWLCAERVSLHYAFADPRALKAVDVVKRGRNSSGRYSATILEPSASPRMSLSATSKH